jgi:hypothetical protein
MLISTALLLDSIIRNSVCTPAKLPCRRVEVGYEKNNNNNNKNNNNSLREFVSSQGRVGRGFDSDPGRKKKKGYILSRDSEVTLSHWSRSIELVITPLIDL